VLRYSKDTER